MGKHPVVGGLRFQGLKRAGLLKPKTHEPSRVQGFRGSGFRVFRGFYGFRV